MIFEKKRLYVVFSRIGEGFHRAKCFMSSVQVFLEKLQLPDNYTSHEEFLLDLTKRHAGFGEKLNLPPVILGTWMLTEREKE